MEPQHDKCVKNVIEKLRIKTLLKKNQQKRQLRERASTKLLSENKFKNFMKKWNQQKKAEFKTVIPGSLFKAISSSERIDLKQLEEFQIQYFEQDHLKVEKALKFYKDELKSIGTIGQELLIKFQQGFNQTTSTINSFQCAQKSINPDQFISGLNLFQQNDVNHLQKSISICQSPREQFDKL